MRSWRDLVIGIPVSYASGRPTNAALAQEHVANLRRLSDSFSDEVAIVQANKPGSGTLYAHAIVSTELPVCGLRLEVPFGQTMLTLSLTGTCGRVALGFEIVAEMQHV